MHTCQVTCAHLPACQVACEEHSLLYACLISLQTSEKQILVREQGLEATSHDHASDVVIYKIDVPANR